MSQTAISGDDQRLARPLADRLDRPAIAMNPNGVEATLDIIAVGSRLIVVGSYGGIFLSDDGGEHWRQAKVPTSVTLTRAFFVNDKTGWAVGHGGIILKSVDAGETWAKQFDGNQAIQLILADARASNDEKAIHDARQFEDDGPDKPFFGLYFSNELTGFVVGAYNFIFRTEDGGKTWAPWLTQVENPNTQHLNDIQAVGKNLMIVGERGMLLKSTDDGATFHLLESPYTGSFTRLLVKADWPLTAIGLQGRVYQSQDEGASWQRVTLDEDTMLRAAAFVDDQLVLVSQDGNGYRLSRSGKVTDLPISDVPPFPTDLMQTDAGVLLLTSLKGNKRIVLGATAAVKK